MEEFNPRVLQDMDLGKTKKTKFLFVENKNSNKLAIIFTGNGNLIKYDFYKTFGLNNEFNITSIFFCDIDKAFYIPGVHGYSNSFQETCKNLKKLIDDHKYKEIFLVGTSMGGFGALMHGLHMESLASVEKIKVIVFNPYTYLSRKIFLNMINVYGVDKIFYIQQRGITYKKTLELTMNIKEEYRDLEPFILNYKYDKNYKLEIHVIHSDNRVENSRVKSLKHFKNIIFYPYDINEHNIAKVLSKRNELIPLLKSIIIV